MALASVIDRALVYAAVLVAGAVLGWAFLTAWRRARVTRRLRRGVEAEREAVHLVERAGYRVIATQVAGRMNVRVDGTLQSVALRADMMLSRGFRTYLAEVKTGRSAPDPTQRDTRRQLLEYALAFQPDGLLLVDMEARTIREVRFETPGSGRRFVRRIFVGSCLLLAGALIEHETAWLADGLAALARLVA